jgi:hypothetical protein
MKKHIVKLFIYYIVVFLTTSCSYAQKKEEVVPKPRIHIDVKKETDEHGNIIRYDSTYTWSWSNIDTGNSVMIKDSIYSHFFKKWKSPFDLDSLFYNPFSFSILDDDWFSFDKQMEKMLQRHREIMKQHDEMMKRFFQPKVIIPEPKQQDNEPQKKNKQSNYNSGIDI